MAKLRWGMIGGGKGSQIGPAHRLGAQADGLFSFVTGALDHNAEAGRAYAQSWGIAEDRAYGTWQEMLEGERAREDRVDLVPVATPNATHFQITKAFLEAGFNVLCEKPMTMTVAEGEEIVRVAQTSDKVCAVNYCYSAYPMVREMREMVRSGELGKIRLVVANFSHGHHADAADADNPRVRWRYDPEMAGESGQMADCGIHALHLASFVTGDEVDEVGRVVDFAELKRVLKGWIDEHWDHSFILSEDDQNGIQALDMVVPRRYYLLPYNPTAENLATYLLEEVCPPLFADMNIRATKVIVWETEEAYSEATVSGVADPCSAGLAESGT